MNYDRDASASELKCSGCTKRKKHDCSGPNAERLLGGQAQTHQDIQSSPKRSGSFPSLGILDEPKDVSTSCPYPPLISPRGKTSSRNSDLKMKISWLQRFYTESQIS